MSNLHAASKSFFTRNHLLAESAYHTGLLNQASTCNCMCLSDALMLVDLLSTESWMQLQASVNQVGPHDLVLRAQQLFHRTEQQGRVTCRWELLGLLMVRGLSVFQVFTLPPLLIVLLLCMPPPPGFFVSFLNSCMCAILGTDND